VPSKQAARIPDIRREPLLVLSPEKGIVWRCLSEMFDAEEVLEAPMEVVYGATDTLRSEETDTAATAWAGPECVVMAAYVSVWSRSAASIAPTLLEDNGFVPAAVRLVQSPDSDPVPLCCTVWRRGRQSPVSQEGVDRPVKAETLDAWLADPTERPPNALGRALGGRRATPQIVAFPDRLRDLAGIGTIFWNRDSRKVQQIVEVLLRLARLAANNRLPSKVRRTYEYVSSEYFGSVSTRKASPKTAIGRFNELLKIAATQNIANAAALELRPEDFLEGTVEGYESPSQYDISSWRKSKLPVGIPL
jgi:hypothetical protein